MVKNNIEVDVKVKLIENGTTQVEVAKKIGTTSQYISRRLKNHGADKNHDGIVNDTFIKIMDCLGYDIVLTYVPKE